MPTATRRHLVGGRGSTSADEAVVAFHAAATNLVPDDTNNAFDIFVRGPGLDASAYAYDRLSRLTSATEPVTGTATYGYDPAGNRLSQVRGTTTGYAYDRADRITAAGATSIIVNAVGDLTAKGTDTFVYDQPNRLRTATVAGATETYAYDGDGVRFSRQVGANPAIGYVSDVNTSLPVTLDDGTRTYVWGLGLAYAVAGSSLEVYHADRLGSVRVITDATGAVTATWRTDEFGVLTLATGSSTQPFAFTGEPRDATGLSYLRARYYDPSLGRFLSRDPWPGLVGLPKSLDRYVYVGNNPATHADPSGRTPDGTQQVCYVYVAPGYQGGVTCVPAAPGGPTGVVQTDFLSGLFGVMPRIQLPDPNDRILGCQARGLGLGIGLIVAGIALEVLSGAAAALSAGALTIAAVPGILIGVGDIAAGQTMIWNACQPSRVPGG